MSTNSFLVFAGIAPHPPIMVPEVGGESIPDVQNSIEGMAEFTRRVIESGAETVVLISPHAPLEADTFVAYSDMALRASFARFRAPEIGFTISTDEGLLSALEDKASAQGFEITRLRGVELDHGTSVPLFFLLNNGWQGKVVALGYSYLSNEDHVRFGSCIRQAIDDAGRRVALVASGDLSHRLRPDAPAGFNPNAHRFDEEVISAIQRNDPNHIELIDHNLRKLAGECGYRSMLVVLGATKELTQRCELINYEAPFGVGYMVAQLAADNDVPGEIPSLARHAVEQLTNTGTPLAPPARPFGLLATPAPCFVSLKTKNGELRGCIGTLEPTKDNLAQEIIANAIGAAQHDPRFEQVQANELSSLTYSVDVLLASEPAELEDLDPKVFGVIVEDKTAKRRGLLLPDIPGITSAEEQVRIATRKAGIGRDEPVKLSRFKVLRFRE